MSKLPFTAFCVEYYAKHVGKLSNEVFATFEKQGLLQLLEQDYEDLHGMSWEYLMKFFDDYLDGGAA